MVCRFVLILFVSVEMLDIMLYLRFLFLAFCSF